MHSEKIDAAGDKSFTDELLAKGKTIRTRLLNVLAHGFTLAVTLLVIKVVELLLHWLYGQEKFFDILPVAWLIQASDVLILLKFVVDSWKEFKE